MGVMAVMFAEARRRGFWFFSNYQGLWFSPDELEEQQAQGRFRWGPTNWNLRDPREQLQQIDEEVAELNLKRARIAGRIEEAHKREMSKVVR